MQGYCFLKQLLSLRRSRLVKMFVSIRGLKILTSFNCISVDITTLRDLYSIARFTKRPRLIRIVNGLCAVFFPILLDRGFVTDLSEEEIRNISELYKISKCTSPSIVHENDLKFLSSERDFISYEMDLRNIYNKLMDSHSGYQNELKEELLTSNKSLVSF